MLNWSLSVLLTNVPTSLASVLSWSMLVVVAVLLVTGVVLTLIYYKKNKRENPAPAVSPA